MRRPGKRPSGSHPTDQSGQSTTSGNLPKSARTDLSFYAVWARSLQRREDRMSDDQCCVLGRDRR